MKTLSILLFFLLFALPSYASDFTEVHVLIPLEDRDMTWNAKDSHDGQHEHSISVKLFESIEYDIDMGIYRYKYPLSDEKTGKMLDFINASTVQFWKRSRDGGSAISEYLAKAIYYNDLLTITIKDKNILDKFFNNKPTTLKVEIDISAEPTRFKKAKVVYLNN
jgi:hypothetical protein